jgi:ribosome maturation factor RimP
MSVESSSGRARRGRDAEPGGAGRRPTAGQQAIRALLEPVVNSAGYDLEDLRVEPAGRRRLVRVIVDADGGVSLDGVAEVNQAVSAALDEADLMGSAPYVLEVSSPGVDRPLTEPRHWRRAAGRLVTVPLTEGGELTGRVSNADDEKVVIEVGGEERAFGYDQVGRGRVQVEFRRDDQDATPTDEDEGGASWTST